VRKVLTCLAACAANVASPLTAQTPAEKSVTLDTGQMFVLADQRRAAGDRDGAILIYRILADNPDLEIRTEARFRHGQLLASQKQFGDAAMLYRAILDEKPDAQRVRIELASVLLLMGKEREALRLARQAQAGGLPPEVSAVVDQYAGALKSLKPYGMSLEMAVAPDSNINRATSAETLDTIIAPLTLSEDARRQSGIGLRLGNQLWLRVPVSQKLRAVARLSSAASLYRQNDFNDVSTSVQAGVEWSTGKTLLSPTIGRTYRWYGGDLYAHTDTLTVNMRRTLGTKAQLTVEAAAGKARYKRNDLQSGAIFDGSIGYERAFNARSGGSITVSAQRQEARDPGYATLTGGLNLLYYREIGKLTLFVTGTVRHLEADKRLFLFPERRSETLWRIGGGATFRQLQISGFAPILRLGREANASTVGIYDYKRNSVELGVTRAF
jgi:outer membrane protein